ncbi:MAG TPA: pitrilysin family protein [Pyrinomonadaceae bacterium]|nr:pitrilysin family protein [Pyrinomonadaceae bacterium]
MSIKRFFVLFLLLTFAMSTNTLAQKSGQIPPIKYQEFKLKNGLRVILHEDHSTPIAAVNLWYHVGSKNEVVGRTGFAHLFEHMMFQGSKNYNDDYFKPLQEAGANINGSTNADRTNYYEVVPSNFLELALFMEADRLGGLLDAMTLEKLNNQRDVVKNERRQRYDNQPYGTAFEKISEIMYPQGHPYNWTTIGSLEDLSAASLDDVKAFFRQYYVPNNTTLVIAGDIDPKQTKKWAEKYFGTIPTGGAITRPNPPMPKLEGEIRKSFEDSVQLPRLYMVWHSVAQGNADEPALDILGRILSSGRGSRLQSNLIYGKQLSQDAGAFHSTREIAGQFQISSTARPQKSLDEIEKEINAEIERIKKEPPTTEEIERAYNAIESQTVFGLQTVLGKADSLNSNATFFGKPDLFQSELDKYRKVTPADVQRVANTYLTNNRLVMSFVPRKEKAASQRNSAANQPTSTEAKKTEDKKDYSANLPKPQADPKFNLPSIDKKKLSNGLNVWFVQQKELPIVSMNLVLNAGGAADPQDRAALSSFTASLLNSGTKTRSAVEIANQLQSIGANVNAGSGWDSANVSMQTLTRNLDKALDIYADVIKNPTFPADELENIRRRALVGFIQRKDNPNAISGVVYSKLLYGKDHPYGKSLTGSEDSVKALTKAEIEKFYATYYRPNNATLIVVGDADSKTLLPKLETAFADWKAAEVPNMQTPNAAKFDKPGIYVVDKPGAAQSVVTIGQVGVSRENPDFFPLQVMNSILGGQFSARVNMNLREDKGYTYGARTAWSFRKGAGPFEASADVQTAVTKESVQEFMKELNGIRGAIPVTQAELDYNKQSLIRRYPAGFETVGQISGQLANLVTYGLPDSYFNDYIANIQKVTVEDVNRVANKYLTPDQMAILIVGDKSVIEPKLKEIQGWGNSIRQLDAEGNPVE